MPNAEFVALSWFLINKKCGKITFNDYDLE